MIDFHTHIPKPGNSLNIINVSIYKPQDLFPLNSYTLGIHPWDSGCSDQEEKLIMLLGQVKKSEVVAIGEIGLDRLKGAELNTQKILFIKQIEIAEQVQKPVIVHCVRAWSELLEVKKVKTSSRINWAIHGFRGNPELTHQLIDHDFYLSFGVHIIDATPSLAEALTITPLNRLFFETDESPIPVEEVYSAASDILNIPIEDLVRQTHKNLDTFLKKDG